MLKKDRLALLLITGALYISNLNDFLLSAFFPGDKKHFANLGYSPELFVGFFVILISLYFLTEKVVFQPLSGSTSKIVVIFMVTVLSMSVSIFYHAADLDDLRPLLGIATMSLYFFIGKGFALSYGDYLAERLWKWIAPLPLVLLLFYLLFWVTGRLEYSDFFSLYRGSSAVEGLKPQIQGGMRSSSIATFAGVNVVFLLYCLQATDKKKIRKVLLLLLGLSIVFLISLLSMGALLAISVVFGAYVIQKRGVKGMVQIGLLCLLIGLAVGLLYSSGLYVLQLKIAEKLMDLSLDQGQRGYRYDLLWDCVVNYPFFGIGWQQFLEVLPPSEIYGAGPHQNILGITAELGIMAGTFFALFTCSIMWAGFNAFRQYRYALYRPENVNMRYLLFMAVASFLFLQMHGLFMDTWQVKQTYLWAGITVGLLQRLQLKYGRQAVQRAFHLPLDGLPHAGCKLR